MNGERAACRVRGADTGYADPMGPICVDTSLIMDGAAAEVLADQATIDGGAESLLDCRTGDRVRLP